MKSTELRANNYVNIHKEGETKYYQLDAYDIYKLDESDCADISPIELTEDLLLKLGAKKQPISFDFRIESSFFSRLSVASNDFENGVPTWYVYFRQGESDDRKEDDCVFMKNDLKYVHELQNLYFAISGVELTIKNK